MPMIFLLMLGLISRLHEAGFHADASRPAYHTPVYYVGVLLFVAPGVALTALIIAVGLAFWLVKPRPTGKFSGSRIGLAIAVGIVLTTIAMVVLGQMIECSHEQSLRRTGALHEGGTFCA